MDGGTLRFYRENAPTYAEWAKVPPARLTRFLALLPPRGAVLELGCVAGFHAAAILRCFALRATDRSLEMAKLAARRLVMVVDDSLTVRKFTTRLLAREGYEVITARDGVDALKLLGEQTPDAILLDIEMPRMDGFEFAKTIRADGKTAGIPIIMITSRTADKHRNRVTELGVDAFLGKPYQEEELLQSLRDVIEVDPAAAQVH